jgi:hypothetical protein
MGGPVNPLRRSLVLFVLSGILAAATSYASPAVSKPKWDYRELVEQVAPGVTLTRIRDPAGPFRLRVLTIKPRAAALTMDVALAKNQLPGLTRTSYMAKTHGALAAINGDFSFPSGQPVHPFAQDGTLAMASFLFGQNFSVSFDEKDVYIRHPVVELSALELDSGAIWGIHRWNYAEPAFGEIAVYTPLGGSAVSPPGGTCAARLYPTGSRSWGPGQIGVVDDYAVESVLCSDLPMPTNGGVVLATPIGSEQAAIIQALVPGETLRLAWSFGWRGVLDSVGGYPLLVREGELVAMNCGTSFCRRRHPRTGVGVTASGRLLLVTVDGRQPKWSVGMTLPEFATWFQQRGAVWAMNLDGGGSTTMVVNGQVVNRPSDAGGERRVSSAILVLPGPDPGEVIPESHSASSAGTAPSVGVPPGARVPPRPSVGWSGTEFAAGLLAARDPASTGGLLDALARGGPGDPSLDLTPEVARVLSIFRSSR